MLFYPFISFCYLTKFGKLGGKGGVSTNPALKFNVIAKLCHVPGVNFVEYRKGIGLEFTFPTTIKLSLSTPFGLPPMMLPYFSTT